MRYVKLHRAARRGFSLLEVLLATSILLGSAVVLGELSRLAMRNATAARLHTRAAELCDRTLSEIVAGIRPATSTGEQPFEDDPAWLYTVEVSPCEAPGLSCVEVICRQDVPEDRRPVEVRLVRWVRGGSMANSTAPASRAGEGGGAPVSSAPVLPRAMP
ncbi:MAG: prepilin-type N-terminal cleavage/methylation domain-containing protein [Pirellulales bacterium]